MTQKRNVRHIQKSRSRKKNNRPLIILWTCIILILAPFIFLAWILISSALDTGTPVLGDRYKGDLDPSITKTQIQEVETKAKAVSGVDKVSVNLATATLRVYADINDDATADTAKTVADEVYDAVTQVLDPNTYFTQADGKKMYDLEVHVYNLDKNRDSDAFVYVVKMKTSAMTDPSSQLVSEPIDAELAQQLRDNVTNRASATATPSDSGEITVGGQDTENTASPTAKQ